MWCGKSINHSIRLWSRQVQQIEWNSLFLQTRQVSRTLIQGDQSKEGYWSREGGELLLRRKPKDLQPTEASLLEICFCWFQSYGKPYYLSQPSQIHLIMLRYSPLLERDSWCFPGKEHYPLGSRSRSLILCSSSAQSRFWGDECLPSALLHFSLVSTRSRERRQSEAVPLRVWTGQCSWNWQPGRAWQTL